MNVGSVEASFNIKGLAESITQLGKASAELGNLNKGLGGNRVSLKQYADSWQDVNKQIAETIRVAGSAKKAMAELNNQKAAITSLRDLAAEYNRTNQAAMRLRVTQSMSAQRTGSNFNQMSRNTSTPLAGQTSPYAPFIANAFRGGLASSTSPIDKAYASIMKLNQGLHQAAGGARAFLTPSKQIQGVLSNWWEHFGRVGLGFGSVYAGLRAIGTAANYAFSIFTGGIKVMDDIRSSGAMVAGMLAMVTKNGKTFADNYSAYFANFTKVIGRVTTLLPQYGLTMEQFIAGTRELAQFGVVVDNDNLKESIISMKLIQEIAANTKQDTRQIRQELQAFFSGQQRMSDQFARTVNNSMPDLAKAIEKIRNEGGTTQQMWSKLSSEMFKMEPSIKAANANLEVQHDVLKASLSVISAMALEATGLYDIWLNGLQQFNDSLFDAKGGLTDFGMTIYKVFFKAWEWTKEWGTVLLGVGQIIYAGLIVPFKALWDILVDVKNVIVGIGGSAVGGALQIFDALANKDYSGAVKIASETVDKINAQFNSGGATLVQNFSDNADDMLKYGLKGVENAWVGLGAAFTDNYVELSKDGQSKLNKAFTGLLAPGGVPEKGDKESKRKFKFAGEEAGVTWAEGFKTNAYAGLEDFFTSSELEAFIFDKTKQINVTSFGEMKTDWGAVTIQYSEQVTESLSSQLEYWQNLRLEMNKYFEDLDIQAGRDAAMDKWKAKGTINSLYGDKFTPVQTKELIDLEIAEQSRLATNWDFEVIRMKYASKSLGEYLSGSFSGFFSSVFNNEIKNSGDLFEGIFSAIRNSFANMLTDMTNMWFDAMMKMMFQKKGLDNVGGAIDSAKSGISIGKDWLQAPSTFIGKWLSSTFGSGIPTGPGSIAGNNSARYGMATGGVIGEPVFGIGTKSGASYSFAEKGPERVLSNSDSKAYAKGASAPATVINFINESGTPLSATQSAPQFDGEKYITSIIVKQMATSPSFRSSMRG